MRIIKNDQIPLEKWRDFMIQNHFSSPFQSSELYDFYNSLSYLSAEVIAVENSKENILALIVVTIQKEPGIKGFFSKRGIIYGGPLLSDESSAKKLLNYLKSHFRNKVIYLETRNFFDYSKYSSAFNKWTYLEHLNVQLSLQNFDDIESYLMTLKYNRRREIKQGINHGASYEVCSTKKEVKEIYNILDELYNTRVKLPLPSLSYFESMINNKNFIVFKVEHDGKIIGGAFCAFIESRRIYTMYYCGIRNYHKKIFPTHLAVLATIEFGIKNSLETVDFMGAGKPNEEYGVRKYKESFDGETVEHGRYILITKPLMYQVGKIGLSIIQRLK